MADAEPKKLSKHVTSFISPDYAQCPHSAPACTPATTEAGGRHVMAVAGAVPCGSHAWQCFVRRCHVNRRAGAVFGGGVPCAPPFFA